MAFLTAANSGALTNVISPKQRLPIAFSKKFLMRLEKLNDEPFTKFVTEYPIMANAGDQVVITKTSALTISTTPLTENQGVKENYVAPTSVNMVLDFYGNDTGWSTKFALTAIDIASETQSAELAINARETLAQLPADDLDGQTTTSWGTSGSFGKLVQAQRTLRNNRVRGFSELNGMYVGVIGPYLAEDLLTEGGAAYKDHFQTPAGSDVLAEGQLSKPVAGIQLFQSNVNRQGTGTQDEFEYFWGEGAIGTVQLRSAVAGADAQPIGMEGLTAALIGYLVPARAELADLYALQNHAVWRAGPLDYTIVDSNRVFVARVSATA